MFQYPLFRIVGCFPHSSGGQRAGKNGVGSRLARFWAFWCGRGWVNYHKIWLVRYSFSQTEFCQKRGEVCECFSSGGDWDVVLELPHWRLPSAGLRKPRLNTQGFAGLPNNRSNLPAVITAPTLRSYHIMTKQENSQPAQQRHPCVDNNVSTVKQHAFVRYSG